MRALKLISLCGTAAAVWLFTSAEAAQPARLGFRPATGLTITGAVDAVYAVQYTTNLAQPGAWRSLTCLKLASSPCLVPNTAATGNENRFYRVFQVQLTFSNLVFLPAGTFVLGSPTNEVGRYDDEGPQTTVTLSGGLWMAPCPVTQQEYLAVTGQNPSSFTGDVRQPVDSVSWEDATNYCALLTRQAASAGYIPAGFRYRLPTEAEYEYAARAGTTTRFCYGDDPTYSGLVNYGWYGYNSDFETHPVEGLLPNPWGLYDMCGNVWEWCADWYGTYPGGTATDPKGPPQGESRVLRGGSWYDIPRLLRAACRSYDYPDMGHDNYGFRVVLAPDSP